MTISSENGKKKKKSDMSSQAHNGVDTRWKTILLGVFYKESSGMFAQCFEIPQFCVISGHCKHCSGILETQIPLPADLPCYVIVSITHWLSVVMLTIAVSSYISECDKIFKTN